MAYINNKTQNTQNTTDSQQNKLIENSPQYQFDIRDYLEYLDETGEKNKYYCPACGGHNLSITPNDKKYKCWNCEDTKAIARILREQAGENQTNWNYKNDSPQEPVNPATVKLAQFPEDYQPKLAETVEKSENLLETRYLYSDSQIILRQDYPQGKQTTNKKGETKTIYKKFSYVTVDADGNESFSKGDRHWEAYQLEEAIAHGYNGYVLAVEGEKATDKARERLRVPTITFRDWNEQGIKPSLTQLQNSGIAGIIYFPDNDQAGTKKAKELNKWCDQIGFPCYTLTPTDVWAEMPEKGDIVDWVENPDYKDMISENLINELETAIHRAVDAKERDRAKAEKEREAKGNDYFVGGDTTLDLKVTETTFGNDWVVMNEVFYQYQPNQGYWKKIPNSKVKQLISHELKKYFTTKETKEGDITYVYKFAKDSNVKTIFSFAKCYLTLDFEPANKHLLSLKNGTVDLRTGELQQHHKNNYLTRHIPLDYKKTDEIPPAFKEFLLRSYGSDQIDLIRAVISMYIDPTAPYGKAVHLIGKSGSGKGFFIRVLKELVGLENVGSIDKFSLLADQDKRHQNLTARSLITAPDISGFMSDLGAFYELVDNGSMSGRALHNDDAYEKQWDVRFILASVHPLQVENAGEGWKRRIIPIPTLGNQNRDIKNDLETKVRQEELALILGWALSMPREERDQMLFNPNLWAKANRDLQFEQDTHSDTIRAFIDACLVPSENSNDTIETNVLYEYYKAFVNVTGGKQKNQNNFVSGLKNSLSDLYAPAKTHRENGKVIRDKAKFTNMTLSAKIYQDSFNGYVCEPKSLSSGGYEDFMYFLEHGSVTTTQECNNDSSKAVVTAKNPTTTSFEPECNNVTMKQQHSSKVVKNGHSIENADNVNRNEWENTEKKGESRCYDVTLLQESQKPDVASDSDVTTTSDESLLQGEADVTGYDVDYSKIDHIKVDGKSYLVNEFKAGKFHLRQSGFSKTVKVANPGECQIVYKDNVGIKNGDIVYCSKYGCFAKLTSTVDKKGYVGISGLTKEVHGKVLKNSVIPACEDKF